MIDGGGVVVVGTLMAKAMARMTAVLARLLGKGVTVSVERELVFGEGGGRVTQPLVEAQLVRMMEQRWCRSSEAPVKAGSERMLMRMKRMIGRAVHVG